MVYKMTDKNVMVKPIYETKTDSGLVIKMDVLPKTLRGEVVAISNHPECSILNVGDVVYFHKHAGKPFFEDKQEYRVMPIIDVEAVETPDWGNRQ